MNSENYHFEYSYIGSWHGNLFSLFLLKSSLCCRLFGYGIGIHLLQSEEPENMPKKTEINPKDSHISFQVNKFMAIHKFNGFIARR